MMNQIPNITVPVDSLNSVIAEQFNLRQDIDANNKERLELKNYVTSLISAGEANNPDNETSSTSNSTLMKTIKSVESIHHIDDSSDDGEKSPTNSPSTSSVGAFAAMSAACKSSVTDDILKQLYAANTRIDANIKVGTELQHRWSELEFTVTSIKNNIDNIVKEIEGLKQYLKIEHLLFHNFRLPFGSLSSREFVGYMVRQINILFPNLPIPVSVNHISTAHPLPTKAKKSNVVVVRFCNRHIKDMIYEARDCVGYGISITEHLTDHTQGIVKKAEELFGRNNVYTESTKVFVKCYGSTGKDIRIYSKDDAHKLYVKHCEHIGRSNHAFAEPAAYSANFNGSYNYSSPPSYFNSNFPFASNFDTNFVQHDGRRPNSKHKSTGKTYGKRKTYYGGKPSTGYSVYNRTY